MRLPVQDASTWLVAVAVAIATPSETVSRSGTNWLRSIRQQLCGFLDADRGSSIQRYGQRKDNDKYTGDHQEWDNLFHRRRNDEHEAADTKGSAIPKRHQAKQSGLRMESFAPETGITGRMG